MPGSQGQTRTSVSGVILNVSASFKACCEELMQITTRGLNISFVYPCSRREVVDAFGRELLNSLSFEARYTFYEGRQGKKKPWRGQVLSMLYVSPGHIESAPCAWINVYSIREEDFSIHVGDQLVRTMKSVMVPWVTAKLAEFPNSPYRSFELVSVLMENGLELFELASLPKSLDVKKIAI